MDYINKIKNQLIVNAEDLKDLESNFLNHSIDTVLMNGEKVISFDGILLGMLKDDSIFPFPRFKEMSSEFKLLLLDYFNNISKTLKEIKREKGSETAKKGFKLESLIVDALNNRTIQANNIIQMMGIDPDFKFISAIETSKQKNATHNVKSDVCLSFESSLGVKKDIHVTQKLVSQSSGFNQLDKRWIETYKQKLDIPENICRLLKFYTGELPPLEYILNVDSLKDKRRIYFNEMTQEDQNDILLYFNHIKEKLVHFLFCGDNTEYAPNFLLVVHDPSESGDVENASFVILPIKDAIQRFYNGEPATFTSEGNLRIGNVSMQRKGGDSGRPSANMLQFKINPALVLK